MQINLPTLSLRSKTKVLQLTLLNKSPKRNSLRKPLQTRRIHSHRRRSLKMFSKANRWAAFKLLTLLSKIQFRPSHRRPHLNTLSVLQEQLNLIQPQQKKQKIRHQKHHKTLSKSIPKALKLKLKQRHQFNKMPCSQSKKRKLHHPLRQKRNLNKSKSLKRVYYFLNQVIHF